MTPGLALTCWARLVMEFMARAGVVDAVISPGSRSTPFAAAILASGRFRSWRVIDERSAGYFALGLARSQGRPVLLLCTSGTAAANYFPAIVEANLSRTPLIVFTADRPVELQHCRAPQTVDQVCMYGAQVRRFVELGAPETDVSVWRKLRRLVVSTVHFSQNPIPGPVHFEARARKPLEPINLPPNSMIEEDFVLWKNMERFLAEPFAAALSIRVDRFRNTLTTNDEERGELSVVEECCIGQRKGLIILGYDPELPIIDSSVLADFSQITGYPIFIDVAHPLRFKGTPRLMSRVVGYHDALGRISEFLKINKPEVVIHVGAPLISGSWEKWMEQSGEQKIVVHIISRDSWPDPSGCAQSVSVGDPTQILREMTRCITHKIGKEESIHAWEKRWFDADGVVSREIARCMESMDFGECVAVYIAMSILPSNSQLVLGNSLPIREVDLLCGAKSRDIATYTIRGANGIDGIVSAGAGVAEGTDIKTLLIVGDVSFLHDIGGLAIASKVKTTLVVMLINNMGGRIFEQLRMGQALEPPMLDWWTTPHSMEFSHAAAQFGVPYGVASSRDELKEELEKAWSRSGMSLVEVVVDSQSARQQMKELEVAIDHRLLAVLA